MGTELGFVRFAGGLVSLLACFDGGGDAGGLVGDEGLAFVDELLPLRTALGDSFLAPLSVIDGLGLAALDEGADLFSCLTGTLTEQLGAFFGSGSERLTGFAAAFRRVKDTNQGAESDAGEEPAKRRI